MKPFDLKLALEGHKVVTRQGHEVTDIVHFKNATNPLRNMVLFGVLNGSVEKWTIDGYFHEKDGKCCLDLLMAPIKREVWVNLYQDEKGLFYVGQGLYSNESGALGIGTSSRHKHIKSIKIHEYEE